MRILFLVCFFTGLSVFSQEKIEREYRVKISEVPKKSLEIVKKWNFKKKVKWYKEESQDGKTFEAKVCYKKHKYSLEFTEKGALLDVEKTVKFKKLPIEIRQRITNVLTKEFQKYRIKKVQVQFLGEENVVYKSVFQLKNNQLNVTKNYEIIVNGKKNTTYKRYEVLINTDGKLLKILPFAPDNNDNLEF